MLKLRYLRSARACLRALLRPSLAAAVMAVSAAALPGCGDGRTTDAEPVPVFRGDAGGGSEVKAVRDFLADRYLYSDRLPAADLTALTTAEQALAALRVEPPDRFSYVDRRGIHQAFFDEGRSLGLGIGYLVDGDRIRLRFVQPQSPAAAAGLARGDELLAIDGTPVASLIAADAVVGAFGPSATGVTVRFDVRRADRRFQVTVTKDWYPVAPVLDSRLIDHQGIKVGYVLLYSFTEPARAAWNEAVAALAAAGARSIVVDLRENGGGRVYVAADIAGSLAPAGHRDMPFAMLRHNSRHRHRDLVIPLPDHVVAGTFQQVVWITSRRSCSASEVLIAGLMPYQRAAIVGEPTCGKPVGFNPHPIGDKLLSAVGFAITNGVGFGEWYDGLQPNCAVDDEPLLAYGDSADPRLREALAVIATGRCSPQPTGKAAIRHPAADPQPRERGIASETGLR